jgi:hypothetical protein
LFFRLSAVGLRPIDRHPTHARPVVQRSGASGFQTIEGGVTRVRGQNTKPATSARTKPDPSAMALTNNAGDVICHAELRVCEPDAPGQLNKPREMKAIYAEGLL